MVPGRRLYGVRARLLLRRYSASIGPRVIDWQVPGCDPWDNPVARQALPGRVKTGEGRHHATDEPRLLMPGNIPFNAEQGA